eukprot:CAMPEP_0179015276 /NCGR_PEP_ID=MMETSP0796-20121207/2703_1 /TAXON_ID=73915 /ORGANISM="Pyrodinium bahamense, Strain pbaha01" /LENGTH=247 /DNA_ID=CAMNT_0020710895 /DNA_START=24 /DNA_END=764 /DNA_ORIENTATION=+
MALTGQVAVITGGAGGIGMASAELWLAEGGSVVLADISDRKGQEFAARFPGFVTYLHCDTRRRTDLEAAAQAAVKLGDLTCWFNNAGFGDRRDSISDMYESSNIDNLRNMIDVNFSAYVEGTSIALKNFSEERGGTIICTASMAGLLPLGAPPVYSATKAADVQFVRAVGLTLGEDSNVRIYCLCPSYTATNQGPPPEQIQKSLGGVLQAKHMARGFQLLLQRRPPNGSVMRVTVRDRGARVVHDLM